MNFEDYFKQAIEHNASDVHLVAGTLPAMRVNGELIMLDESVIDNQVLEENIKELIGQENYLHFFHKKELDISATFFECRFRVNLHYQRGKVALSARLISNEIPTPEQLNFTTAMRNLTNLRDGLVLVTGPTGCGKSTTLASIIETINKERCDHIITIEDPIEYLFDDKKSIIEQREIGADTLDFVSALKYILRQDPNVIMIGEMRDAETIAAALTAAETGHLVLSTLHTSTAADAISRIVDSFPGHQQAQILIQLSSSLRAIVSQQLIPKLGGGRIAAREILINTQAIANLIRRNQISQIPSIIQTNSQEGMVPMNKAIDELVARGLVNSEVARSRKRDTETKAIYY